MFYWQLENMFIFVTSLLCFEAPKKMIVHTFLCTVLITTIHPRILAESSSLSKYINFVWVSSVHSHALLFCPNNWIATVALQAFFFGLGYINASLICYVLVAECCRICRLMLKMFLEYCFPKGLFIKQCNLNLLIYRLLRCNGRLMYIGRSFNMPPRATPRAFDFFENHCSNSALPGPKCRSNAPHTRVHSGDQMPPPWGHFTGT